MAVKRLASGLALLFAVFVLSGCIKANANLTVNGNDTVSGTMILAVDKSIASAAGVPTEQIPQQAAQQLLSTPVQGVSSAPYDVGGYIGTKLTLDQVPLSKYFTGRQANDLQIRHEGDKFVVSGVLDLTANQL